MFHLPWGQPRNTPTFAAAGSADPLLFTIVNGTIARPMLFIASVARAKLVKPITALAALPSMIVGRRLMFLMLCFLFPVLPVAPIYHIYFEQLYLKPEPRGDRLVPPILLATRYNCFRVWRRPTESSEVVITANAEMNELSSL
jgi:hypothetical protein